jgi:sarcosine oxidase, subunit gamma
MGSACVDDAVPSAQAVGCYGADPPAVTLAPITIATAWNMQGPRAAAEASRLFGVTLPETPNGMARGHAIDALWLGPASWLIVAGAAPPGDLVAQRDALNAAGAALFDVSASRVAFAVGGTRSAMVLAAGCPLDFHPSVFPVGHCAQSVFARVNAIVCRPARDGAFVVMVARSFGRDVWHGLCAAAMEYGYEVQPARAWPAR